MCVYIEQTYNILQNNVKLCRKFCKMETAFSYTNFPNQQLLI